MRTIAIYACMVVSFLQLASCSAHHRMYGVDRGANEQVEKPNFEENDLILKKCSLIIFNKLRRWNKIIRVINMVLLPPVLFSCWYWWRSPQASDSLVNDNNAVMHYLTRGIDELNGQLTSIEDNLNLERLPFLTNAMDRNHTVWEQLNSIAEYLGHSRNIKENQYCLSIETNLFEQ